MKKVLPSFQAELTEKQRATMAMNELIFVTELFNREYNRIKEKYEITTNIGISEDHLVFQVIT